MTKEEIIEVIKGLSVLELNELVKACEEEFGVSAAAGVVVAAAGAGGDELKDLAKLGDFIETVEGEKNLTPQELQ